MDVFRDPVVSCSALALPGAAAVAWRARRLAPTRAVPATALAFLFQVGAFLMLGHLWFVAAVPLRAEPGAWTYEFRFYGMVLFGVVVLTACVAGVTGAVRLVGARPGAARRCALAAAAVLAVNLPLIPLQPFATPVSVGAGLALAAAAVAGRRGA